MRFATRAFAFCFVPFALLLGLSYWWLRSEIRELAREHLRAETIEKQQAFKRLRAGSQLQVRRLLRLASENPALRNGVRQLNLDPDAAEARSQVEDQLRELSRQTGLPMISIENFKGAPVGWVIREDGRLDSPSLNPPDVLQGLTGYRGRLFQIVTAPFGEGAGDGGYISVGEDFDLDDFGGPVFLLRHGAVVKSSFHSAAGQSLAACENLPECEVRIGNHTYLSIRMDKTGFGSGYVLRGLEDIDAITAPADSILNGVFLVALIGAGLISFLLGRSASMAMSRPLAGLASHFRNSEAAGRLMELTPESGCIVEIRELVESFNRAASSIKESRDGLHAIYVEFAKSLANALDARDGYTANHSQRVSQIAMEIAHAIDLPPEEQEVLRIGALLHDIGKIGIPDYVLQKSGVLSDSEFALIRQHTVIGCRILEGVRGFNPYLPVVELHHENWDGSGYPYGLSGKAVPLGARIVHVADAWDAMTSDRPYRRGFTHRRALAIIQQNAGTQFDPEIAEAFLRLMNFDASVETESMLRLAAAVEPSDLTALTEEVFKGKV